MSAAWTRAPASPLPTRTRVCSVRLARASGGGDAVLRRGCAAAPWRVQRVETTNSVLLVVVSGEELTVVGTVGSHLEAK